MSTNVAQQVSNLGPLAFQLHMHYTNLFIPQPKSSGDIAMTLASVRLSSVHPYVNIFVSAQ